RRWRKPEGRDPQGRRREEGNVSWMNPRMRLSIRGEPSGRAATLTGTDRSPSGRQAEDFSANRPPDRTGRRNSTGGNGNLAAIVVETAARLAAEPAGLDIFHEQRAGTVFRVSQ